MQTLEEPQTIFDLTPDELDILILHRKLSPKNQAEFDNYIFELTKDKMQER